MKNNQDPREFPSLDDHQETWNHEKVDANPRNWGGEEEIEDEEEYEDYNWFANEQFD